MIVAIDGPAGAGKGTVSLALAEALGFQYVDTGALYRATALLCRERGVDWDDDAAAGAVAETVRPRFAVIDGVNRLSLETEQGTRDVTADIRTPEVSEGASVVASQPAVRAALLGVQRALATSSDVVMEGRDIGTVVFPAAELKVFLTASVDERARRRWLQATKRGDTVCLEDVRAAIVSRDERDAGRAVAPLRRAPDARELDATALSVEEAVSRLVIWADAVRQSN